MAYLPPFLVLLLVSLLSPLASARFTINDDYSIFLVDTICKQTKDYTFCVAAFNSDPRTPNADIEGFGQISLDLASRNASNTLNYISQLIKKSTDAEIKKKLSACQGDYQNVIGGIQQAYKLLASKSYPALKKEIGTIGSGVLACKNSFRGVKNSPLTTQNQNSENLVLIAGLTADLLIKKS